MSHHLPDVAITRRHDHIVRGVSPEVFDAWGERVAQRYGDPARHVRARGAGNPFTRRWMVRSSGGTWRLK